MRVGSALVHAIRNGLIIHVTIGALTRGMPFVTSTEQRCILQAWPYITSGRQRRFSMRGPPLFLVTTVHISLNPRTLKEPRGNNNTSAIIVTGWELLTGYFLVVYFTTPCPLQSSGQSINAIIAAGETDTWDSAVAGDSKECWALTSFKRSRRINFAISATMHLLVSPPNIVSFIHRTFTVKRHLPSLRNIYRRCLCKCIEPGTSECFVTPETWLLF